MKDCSSVGNWFTICAEFKVRYGGAAASRKSGKCSAFSKSTIPILLDRRWQYLRRFETSLSPAFRRVTGDARHNIYVEEIFIQCLQCTNCLGFRGRGVCLCISEIKECGPAGMADGRSSQCIERNCRTGERLDSSPWQQQGG